MYDDLLLDDEPLVEFIQVDIDDYRDFEDASGDAVMNAVRDWLQEL